MTAEVAIMNKHAVVFAADSATTVTSWVRGSKETRFFKGANKLFQLSNSHPVGLMINGSASLQRLPWEIIVKEFRKQLGSNSCDHLETYSQQFFNFVRGHTGLFPPEHRQQAWDRNIIRGLLGAAESVKRHMSLGDAMQTTLDAYSAAVTALIEEVRKREPTPPVTDEDVEAAVARELESTVAELNSDLTFYEVPFADASKLIAELAIRSVMADYTRFLDATGIVIGGYGDADYFPSFDVYDCYGFLLDHLVCTKDDRKCKAIALRSEGVIEAFATTSMIDTFQLGVSQNVYVKIAQATERCLSDFATELRDLIAPGAELPDLTETIRAHCSKHEKAWMDETFDEHYKPLARVVGSLPVPDMAALAKSLVELQSLKERVTEPTESVSGPIDVAAISKHDGFVWIDRKHYFRPELNPRFLHRIASDDL